MSFPLSLCWCHLFFISSSVFLACFRKLLWRRGCVFRTLAVTYVNANMHHTWPNSNFEILFHNKVAYIYIYICHWERLMSETISVEAQWKWLHACERGDASEENLNIHIHKVIKMSDWCFHKPTPPPPTDIPKKCYRRFLLISRTPRTSPKFNISEISQKVLCLY